jgi:tRNA (pseudouridine54-N1)-methyltransferase
VRAGGLSALLKEHTFALAEEGGEDIRMISDLPTAFVLSDHLDLTEQEKSYFSASRHISVGPYSLHADHAITLIHNELDRREAGWS